MRIGFVTLGYAPLRTSGLDISGERLVRGLLERGHHVTVIAGARQTAGEIQHDPSLEIQRVSLGVSNWIGYAQRAAQRLRQLERNRHFDIVHFWDVHFAYAYRGKYVASLQQSFRQRWNSWDRTHSHWLTQAYRITYYSLARVLTEIPSLRRASGLMAGSLATRNEFIDHYHIDPNCIAVARHGIDANFFHRVPDQARALREKLGLGEREPVLLFVGFITPRKGLDYLAQALPLIRPTPRLVLVGKSSPSARARFERLLGTHTPHIIEVGSVPDEDMPAFYSMADIYVSASLLEGFGLPLAESLACETPVVAADAGSVSEVVGPGGILVPPRSSIQLANAVSDLLQDPLRRQTLGQCGKEHVKQEFSLERMVQSTEAAYRQFQ